MLLSDVDMDEAFKKHDPYKSLGGLKATMTKLNDEIKEEAKRALVESSGAGERLVTAMSKELSEMEKVLGGKLKQSCKDVLDRYWSRLNARLWFAPLSEQARRSFKDRFQLAVARALGNTVANRYGEMALDAAERLPRTKFNEFDVPLPLTTAEAIEFYNNLQWRMSNKHGVKGWVSNARDKSSYPSETFSHICDLVNNGVRVFSIGGAKPPGPLLIRFDVEMVKRNCPTAEHGVTIVFANPSGFVKQAPAHENMVPPSHRPVIGLKNAYVLQDTHDEAESTSLQFVTADDTLYTVDLTDDRNGHRVAVHSIFHATEEFFDEAHVYTFHAHNTKTDKEERFYHISTGKGTKNDAVFVQELADG
jgi:hypothetical protein